MSILQVIFKARFQRRVLHGPNLTNLSGLELISSADLIEPNKIAEGERRVYSQTPIIVKFSTNAANNNK